MLIIFVNGKEGKSSFNTKQAILSNGCTGAKPKQSSIEAHLKGKTTHSYQRENKTPQRQNLVENEVF